MRSLGWVVIGVLTLSITGSSASLPSFPDAPPAVAAVPVSQRLIKLRIVVDESAVQQHGDGLEGLLQEAVALHNIEWRRVRNDWFTIGEIAYSATGGVRDALYLLTGLLHHTVQEPGTIHVRVTGEPLEIYSNGVSARSIGGLAFRGSDVLVVSAAAGVGPDLLAYYLFHEIGHLWDALDLPFGGGHSTFGTKRFATFSVDAGNSQIIEDSPGPRPRDTPLLATAAVRAKFAAARAAVRDPVVYRDLHDLLLHEPSRANPAYVAKRDALLARAGKESGAVKRLLRRYEIGPQYASTNRQSRRELAEQYWIVNDAIARGELAVAEAALADIETLQAGEGRETRILISAVGKKIRRRAGR